ncbi:MAG: MarR family transcriptional regulator [Beijerinckiaceae bacterium]|nr:MarR family transcriptional regulator [Beijerinckiaceae bacterium]
MSVRPTDTRTADIMLRHWREAVPNDRLAHLVKDATRGLHRALQVRLARHNVAFGHWVFLRILWVRDGITQRELSEEAGLMEPTTFSALTVMEKLGYIERRKLPHSRKNVYVFLTPAGRALKKKLVPLAEEVNEIAVQGVDPADVATARRMLLQMIENIARDEAEHADPARAARARKTRDDAAQEGLRHEARDEENGNTG